MILKPASDFTLEELTDAYNQTRTDYLIPMPMNPARLKEYIVLYDVDLPGSTVATAAADGTVIGLGMLGLRDNQSWITRLGVLPHGRRKGVGSAILEALLDTSRRNQVQTVWLEVIKGNLPAHELFIKYHFRTTRELIVARRSPRAMRSMSAVLAARKIRYLQHDEVIELHCSRPGQVNWLNATNSMRNVHQYSDGSIEETTITGPIHDSHHLNGISVEFRNGSKGWISYQATTLQLKHIWVEVVSGDPTQVTADLLGIMHRLHASQDAVIENIPDDEQWHGFIQSGYFEVFRRIEMALDLVVQAPTINTMVRAED
jgi:ribosomal protein S18 acetylase RimI-like enzyme